MFEIIDFHTHPFLDPEHNISLYAGLSENTLDWFVETLDGAGISRFCGSVIHGNSSEASCLKAENETALRIRDLTKGRYIPGIHVSPLHVAKSILEIKRAHDNDVRLIGELVPYAKGWTDYSCAGFSEILSAAEAYAMTVSMHTTDLDQMEKAVQGHSGLGFVFAHPGEHDRIVRHIAVMKKHPNVYLDISGTGLFRYGMLKYLVNEVGADRILFGTDFPVCNPYCYVSGVNAEDISEKDKARIFSENAKGLLL